MEGNSEPRCSMLSGRRSTGRELAALCPPGPPLRRDAEGAPAVMGACVHVHGSGHVLGDVTRTRRCLRAWVSHPSSALALWTGMVALRGAGSAPGAVCHQAQRNRALLLAQPVSEQQVPLRGSGLTARVWLPLPGARTQPCLCSSWGNWGTCQLAATAAAFHGAC